MRPILSAKQGLDGLLRNFQRRGIGAIEEAKAEGLKIAQDLSPRPNSPYADHPYATGEYASKWVWKGNRLINEAEYRKYTDDGYTRKGKGTARSFKARGSERYSDQISLRIADKLREAFKNGRR